VGKPIEFSDNCYLIRHGSEWLLWDTGYPDSAAAGPVTTPVGTATRAKTLMAQLAQVGVKPSDIRFTDQETSLARRDERHVRRHD